MSRVPFTVYVDAALKTDFRIWCMRNGVKISDIFEPMMRQAMAEPQTPAFRTSGSLSSGNLVSPEQADRIINELNRVLSKAELSGDDPKKTK